jgi:hypothetical protein
MSETRPILCGKCHVPIETRVERDGETWGTCPVCGREDRMDEIIRETTGYHVDKIARLVPNFKSSSVTIKGPPERQYRWIIGD